MDQLRSAAVACANAVGLGGKPEGEKKEEKKEHRHHLSTEPTKMKKAHKAESEEAKISDPPKKKAGTLRAASKASQDAVNRNPTPAPPLPTKDNAVNPAVLQKCEKFIAWASGLGVDGLANLFNNQLVTMLPPTKPTPSYNANPEKNRYQDVICLEETRVKLVKEKPEDGDYIHANWIKFKDHDRVYIAAQGPLENTIEDFWRMIFQEQCQVLVNLTNCVEEGKVKCARYWPEEKDGSYKTYGRFTVTLKKVEMEEKDKVHILVLEVLPEGCSDALIVRMLHAVTWPDGKTLHSTCAVLRLIKTIFKVDTLAKGPVVVHCSAGLGRTGTLVLIDYLLFKLFRGRPVHVVDAFTALRQQRSCSIQKEGQFVYAVVSTACYISQRMPVQFAERCRKLEADFKSKFFNVQ